jgi:hypothetical protein
VLAAHVNEDLPMDAYLDEDARARVEPRTGLPASGFINPYNPCLPHYKSRTCKRYVDGNPWAPFNAADKYYFIWD